MGLFWAGCIGLSSVVSWIVFGESAGIGSEGQFAPIKLSCEGSCEGSVLSFFLEVKPSMTAVGLAARRVKLRRPPVASVEGGSTVQQKSENYKIRQEYNTPEKNTKRLEQVDTHEKLKKHSRQNT